MWVLGRRQDQCPGCGRAPPTLGRLALGSVRGARAAGPPRSRLLHHRLPAGPGNELPPAWPPRHCLHMGVKPGLRGALEGDRARGCDPRFTPAPAPSPGPARCVLSLPAGGVSAGAALGKEAVERPAAAGGGAINLEQMRPDSHPARGFGGGPRSPHRPIFLSAAELGGLQAEVTRTLKIQPHHQPSSALCVATCGMEEWRAGSCLSKLGTFLPKKSGFLRRD